MSTEAEELFLRADQLPDGPARVAALEVAQQSADAEAADTDLPFRVRLTLMRAYMRGAETVRSLVPFAWCVAELDRDPQRYAHLELELLWAFKWVPGTLVSSPDIPLGHTLELLDDMERRFQAGGHSLHAVHAERHTVASHIGDVAAAEEHFRAWSIAPRDQLSDCAGCDPSGKVRHLASVGRHEEAVATGAPVLQGSLTCSEQPQSILANLLESFVRTGRHDEAADAHARGYRLTRTDRSALWAVALHVRFLACTYNDARALETVERHLAWLDDPWSPWSEMRFAAAAALATSRVDPAHAVRTPQGEQPAAEVAARLAARARELAAQFDARNGTTAQSDIVERMLVEEPWADVPLSARERRVREIRQLVTGTPTAAPGLPPVAVVPPVEGSGTDALLEHFEARWRESDDEGALAALVLLEKEPQQDWSDQQHGRVLVARGLRAWREDLDAARELFQAALAPLEAAGDARRVQQVRGRIGSILHMQGQYAEARAIGEEPLRWLVAHETDARARARWTGRLGELMLAHDPPEAERLLRAARAEQDPRDAGAAELFHGDALAMLERHAEADAAYSDAILAAGRVDPRAVAMPLMRRGALRLRTDDAEGAAADLAEAVAIVTAEGASPAPLLVDLASAYLQVGRAGDAVQAGEEALPWVVEQGDLNDQLQLRHLLAAASAELGERAPEVEHLRAAQAALDGWEPEDEDGIQFRRDRLANLADREGAALSALDRDDEAVVACTRAADLWAAVQYVEGAARSLRAAARSAHWSGQRDAVEELRTRADGLLATVEGDEAAFHRAGLAWDRSGTAADLGDLPVAIGHAQEAERLYEAIGYREAVDDAVLRQVHLGAPVPTSRIAEIFDRVQERSEVWYDAGYLLVDRLDAEGHARRAKKVRKQLEA